MIKCDVNEEIIEFLKKDLLINLNILGVIENVPSVEIYVDDISKPNGVVVRNGYFNYVYTKDDEFIDKALESLFKEGEYGFAALEEGIANKIKSRYKVQWDSPCDLYYLPKENLKAPKKCILSNIDIKDAEIVNSFYTYRDECSADRIKDDILKRESSAIYINGEIVCWVLLHDDNSMGIMYTKEEHRKKGYAVQVTLDLCNKVVKNGGIPFLHITDYNTMSPGLAKKCGFVQCGKICWFAVEI